VRFWPTANRYEHNWEIWSQESNSDAWINVAGIVNIYGAGDGLILKWGPTWWGLPGLVVQQTSISGAMDIQLYDEVIKKGHVYINRMLAPRADKDRMVLWRL